MTDRLSSVRFRRPFLGAFGSALLLAGMAAAQAEEVNLIQQRGHASLGIFLNNSEMKVRVDAQGEQGTVVDWGETFGDKNVNRFRLDGLWRFTPKHHLRMMFTDYGRESTETIDGDIEWQGETIPASATVRARVGFTIIEAAYEYAFIHSENLELAAGIGLHYTEMETSLRATVNVGGSGGTAEVGGPVSVKAPLPVVGARGMWRMGGNFYLEGQIQYFALALEGFDGSIFNYRAAAIWQPRKYVGVGLGFDSFNVDVDLEKNAWTGTMNWTYSGPQLFFNVSF
jgi:hypothetical protein